MNTLKKALCLIFSAMLISPPPVHVAVAEGEIYAMALSTTVYLCEEREEKTTLFAIPYTYCVQILKEYDDWYGVRYAEDDGLYEPVWGYCKKNDLMIVGSMPENSYLYYPIEVTLTSSPLPGPSLPAIKHTVTAAFLGNYFDGAAAYSCIMYNGGFGYIEGEISDYTPNPIPSAPTFSNGTVKRAKDNNAKLITATLIAALAVGAVVILLFTGRRKKPQIRQ